MTRSKVAASTLAIASLVALGGPVAASAHGGQGARNGGWNNNQSSQQYNGGNGSGLGLLGFNFGNFGSNGNGRTNTIADKAGTNMNNRDCWHNRYNGYSNQSNWDEQYRLRLDAAVASGKLTDYQRQAVLAKHAELVTFARNHQGGSWSSNRDAWAAEIDNLQTWSNQTGIALSWLF